MNEALQMFLDVSQKLPGRSVSQAAEVAFRCKDHPGLLDQFKQLSQDPNVWHTIMAHASVPHERGRQRAVRMKRESQPPELLEPMDVVRVLQGEAVLAEQLHRLPREQLAVIARLGKRKKFKDQEAFARDIEQQYKIQLPSTRF